MKRQLMVLALGLALVGAASRVAVADVAELVGNPAPAIRARPVNSDGEVSLHDYRGRVVLLAFVATWCGSCRRLAPTLDALRREHGAAGLEVVALSHEPRRRIRDHVREQTPGIPWLQCTGRTAVSYQADALPTLVLVNRRGEVHAAYQGGGGDVQTRLRRDVAALMREAR